MTNRVTHNNKQYFHFISIMPADLLVDTGITLAHGLLSSDHCWSGEPCDTLYRVRGDAEGDHHHYTCHHSTSLVVNESNNVLDDPMMIHPVPV